MQGPPEHHPKQSNHFSNINDQNHQKALEETPTSSNNGTKAIKNKKACTWNINQAEPQETLNTITTKTLGIPT